MLTIRTQVCRTGEDLGIVYKRWMMGIIHMNPMDRFIYLVKPSPACEFIRWDDSSYEISKRTSSFNHSGMTIDPLVVAPRRTHSSIELTLRKLCSMAFGDGARQHDFLSVLIEIVPSSGLRTDRAPSHGSSHAIQYKPTNPRIASSPAIPSLRIHLHQIVILNVPIAVDRLPPILVSEP